MRPLPVPVIKETTPQCSQIMPIEMRMTENAKGAVVKSTDFALHLV
jgi:hypothetical protein